MIKKLVLKNVKISVWSRGLKPNDEHGESEKRRNRGRNKGVKEYGIYSNNDRQKKDALI